MIYYIILLNDLFQSYTFYRINLSIQSILKDIFIYADTNYSQLVYKLFLANPNLFINFKQIHLYISNSLLQYNLKALKTNNKSHLILYKL